MANIKLLNYNFLFDEKYYYEFDMSIQLMFGTYNLSVIKKN